MDTVYRFRPVSRLIDDDGISGELDGQYIFFADIQSLNDPLEGYKNVFFSGDKIAWRNMLQNYAKCLTGYCIQIFPIFPGDSKKEDAILIPSLAITSTLNDEIADRAIKRIGYNSPLFSYIDRLGDGRKIGRLELTGHLDQIHMVVLSSVLSELAGHPRNIESLGVISKLADEQMKKLKYLSQALFNGYDFSRSTEELIERTFLATAEIKLRNRCDLENPPGKEWWSTLLFDYPEKFVHALDSLIHPNWYVACFMEGCADSSMWGTYGGRHRDVCLKFKLSELDGQPALELRCPVGLDSQGVIFEYIKRPLKKVLYDEDFVDIDFFRSLGQLSAPRLHEWYGSTDGEISICADEMQKDTGAWRASYWEKFDSSSRIKLKAWDREQEWRISMHTQSISLSDPKLRKIGYKFDSLDGIIFGINTSMEDKIKLIKRVRLLCQNLKRDKFNFYQAAYDSSSRNIKYDLLSNIDVGYQEQE